MNLYDKIYEAVNTGIQKALIINNDQLEDSSIKWHGKEINGNINILNHYVYNLLNDNDDENWYALANYCEQAHLKYNVNNLDELNNIYFKMPYYERVISRNWLQLLLNCIDTTNIISFILEDNTEISLEYYLSHSNKNDIAFLKISDEFLKDTDSEILIYMKNDHYISNEFTVWQPRNLAIQPANFFIPMVRFGEYNKDAAMKYISGYENCKNLNRYRKLKKIPALDYCKIINVSGYEAYIPSIAQLHIIGRNKFLIDWIFKELDLDIKITKNENVCFWSSSECSAEKQWYLYKDSVNASNKNFSFTTAIYPFFKKVN